MKRILSLLSFAAISGAMSAQAPAAAAPWTRDQVFNYTFLITGVVLFFFFLLRSFYIAHVTLRDNGGETALTFPVFRSFASSPKAVAVFMGIVVLCILIWVLSY